jgi:hypothetical protein
MVNPITLMPRISMAQVAGSGTAATLPTTPDVVPDGENVFRFEIMDRQEPCIQIFDIKC